jgi:NAD(P)-dependent dehydrogenase (short-subunit alcohol dehydrogenase family)
MQDFTGKVAVVTGAASGIGRALALHGAAAGMSLVVADIDGTQLTSLASELQQQDAPHLALPTDVTDPAAVERLAAAAWERFGRVDLLFNNAGVLLTGYSWERSIEDWRWLLDVNLMGVVHGITSFVPRMIAQGGTAHIVNTGSVAALLSAPLLAHYTASKMAIRGITETLQLELAQVAPGIGVSLLCPGPINTAIKSSGEARDGNATAGVDEAMQQGPFKQETPAYMAPEACAAIVFEAIRDGKFWIFTHPEFSGLSLQQLQAGLERDVGTG